VICSQRRVYCNDGYNKKGYEISKPFDRKRSKKLLQVLYVSPLCAWHLCIGYGARSFFDLVLPFYKALFPKDYRGNAMARLVPHHGRNEEIADSLRVYGIPKSCFDISIGGTTNKHDFEQKKL
jgi:hypothetical protein